MGGKMPSDTFMIGLVIAIALIELIMFYFYTQELKEERMEKT
jgi:hypothetical protein